MKLKNTFVAVSLFSSCLVSSVTAEKLSNLYINDKSISTNPAILFHEDFESGWGKWAFPSSDTQFLSLINKKKSAHSGNHFLRSNVTKKDLNVWHHISSKTRYIFQQPTDEIYWRFYTRLNPNSATPHHWVKLAATDGIFDVRGKAGINPDGNQAFWFDMNITNHDLLEFYVYWHNMRSGRCNNGSTTKGCDGDQGTTYYYGNTFMPSNQNPIERDIWACIEIHAKLNDIGKNNGELTLWVNDKKIGGYKEGSPTGTWLRSRFHTENCKFKACSTPSPFTGFNFRTNKNVQFRELYMDAYYQLNTLNKKTNQLEKSGIKVSNEHIIDYDDIVIATERIGCMVKNTN